MAAVALGTKVASRYALVRMLGEGAMGAVYEAENTWTGRRVALKLLRADHATREEFVARFMQEARIATRIAHPNIVEVFDMGRDPETESLYIVQELLRGEDLRTWLSRAVRAKPSQALGLMAPVLAALDAAHARGVVHRDVKPENIFLARENNTVVPKLIDFGISKVIAKDDPDAQGLYSTAFGQTIGTPEYMAPEQLLGDRTLDGRVDVWAVGVVLYEMLTGVSPFEAPTSNATVARVMTETPLLVTAFVPDLPAPLAELVRRALEHKREDRFDSARAMLDELTTVYRALPRLSEPELALPKATRRARSEPRPAAGAFHSTGGGAAVSGEVPRPALPQETEEGVAPIPIEKRRDSAIRVTNARRSAETITELEAAELTLVADDDENDDEDEATVTKSSPPKQLGDEPVFAVETLLTEGRLSEVVSETERVLMEHAGAARGELLGRLRYAQSVAYHWLGDAVQSAWCASEALLHLPQGSGRWFNALGEAALAYGTRGEGDVLVALTEELRAAWPAGGKVTPPVAAAVARLAGQLILAGWPELSVELMDSLFRSAERDVIEHPSVRGWVLHARALRARAEREPGLAVSFTAQAITAFEEASDPRNACVLRAELGDVRRTLGDYAGSERVLRMASDAAAALGLELVHTLSISLAITRARGGYPRAACALASDALAAAQQRGNRRLEAHARLVLAEAYTTLRETEAPDEQLRVLLAWPGLPPAQRIVARALRSTVQGVRGQWEEALVSAERAMEQLRLAGGLEEGEALVHLAYVRALRGCGKIDAALAALREAIALLDARAEKLGDPVLRHWFFENVPEHRALRLMASLGLRRDEG